MVETRKGKIETREGTTTEPDSEMHTDYSKVFENDQPDPSVNTNIFHYIQTDHLLVLVPPY
jgi:hypothetical protein